MTQPTAEQSEHAHAAIVAKDEAVVIRPFEEQVKMKTRMELEGIVGDDE